jgi:hypothetical protein
VTCRSSGRADFERRAFYGAIDTDDFENDAVTELANNDWWWYPISAALAVVGIVAQLRAAEQLSRSMREAWATDRPGC